MASWHPAEMAARQQAEAEQDACYLATLEHEARWEPGDEPEDDPCDPGATGSLLGHDDGAQRAWLTTDPDDETYCN